MALCNRKENVQYLIFILTDEQRYASILRNLVAREHYTQFLWSLIVHRQPGV